MNHQRWAVATLAVAVLLAACSGDDEPDQLSIEPSTTTTTTTAPDSDEGETAGEPTSTEAPPADPPVTPLADLRLQILEVATFDEPIAMVTRPGSPDFYVAEKGGRVRRLDVENGRIRIAGDTVLDLRREVSTGNEQGLLGLAFSSDGRRLFASYTDPSGTSRVVEYPMEGDRADRSEGRELLAVDQPFGNHNGGHITFGPDGFLWIGLGDGGSSGDPDENAEDPTTLLGSILRIDPDGRTGDRQYAIPNSNPFADGAEGAPEVWLHGVRNPWRFTFDAETGDLWVGDVGQNEREEITVLRAAGGRGRGANLGWDYLEGTRPFEGDPPPGLVPPIFEYDRTGGCSVIGGYVYRGRGMPDAAGLYFFADYCAPGIRALRLDGNRVTESRTFDLDVANVVSFAVDNGNELYVLSQNGELFVVAQMG